MLAPYGGHMKSTGEGMDAALSFAGLGALLLFARSLRSGFSGPAARWLSLLQLPAAVAAMWLLALTIGWWTIAAFLLASVNAGILINRKNLATWVSLEPFTGLLGVGLPAMAWAVHLLA